MLNINNLQTTKIPKPFPEPPKINSRKLNYKKAIFTLENTYYDNTLDYDQFNKTIETMAQLCRQKIKEKKLNPQNDMVKKMTIFNFMMDTFSVKLPGKEQRFVHMPMKYDFEDIWGERDLTKMFVTKLLRENTGNCTSLPELYLILSQELGTPAFLSRSPMHSFIKIQDENGNWYNLELTTNCILSDYHYMNNSFIKAEAIRNKIYLAPLTEKETISQFMSELASVYIRKHGYDSFVRQCIDTALVYYPKCTTAYLVNANYHTARALYVWERVGSPHVSELKNFPQADSLRNVMLRSYDQLMATGYEDTPEEVYDNWLKAIEKEKQKPEYKKSIQLLNIIK